MYAPVVAVVDNISHADRVRFVRFNCKCSRSYHTDGTLVRVYGETGPNKPETRKQEITQK